MSFTGTPASRKTCSYTIPSSRTRSSSMTWMNAGGSPAWELAKIGDTRRSEGGGPYVSVTRVGYYLSLNANRGDQGRRTEEAQRSLLAKQRHVRVDIERANSCLVFLRVCARISNCRLAQVLPGERVPCEERIVARLDGNGSGHVRASGVTGDDEAFLEVDLELSCVLSYLSGCQACVHSREGM